MRKPGTLLLVGLILLAAGFLIGARTALNNAILTSDLDANNFKILNLPPDQPMPPPTEGATIPPTWLGTTDTTAAAGNLAEFKTNKDQPNGYASLDSGGKVPSAEIPTGVGLGTVTSVGVTTANGVSASGGPITSSGNFTFSLGNITPTKVTVSGSSGLGYIALTDQGAGVPVEAAPHLWAIAGGYLAYWGATRTNGHNIYLGASAITTDRTIDFPDKSGTVSFLSDIPTTIIGVGGSHKGGLVPDTGASGTGSDYLARDATWKPIPTAAGPTYQPQVPAVTISPSTNTTGARNITLGDSLSGTNLFYEIGASTGPFLPYSGTVSLPAGSIIYTYAAKAGYTNSPMANYTNPNP